MNKMLMTDEELESVVGGVCYIYRKDLGNGKSAFIWATAPLTADQQKHLYGVACRFPLKFSSEASKMINGRSQSGFSFGMSNNRFAAFCERQGRKLNGFEVYPAAF